MKITTVGIDLAKNVFQIHAVDERGKTVFVGASAKVPGIRRSENTDGLVVGAR